MLSREGGGNTNNRNTPTAGTVEPGGCAILSLLQAGNTTRVLEPPKEKVVGAQFADLQKGIYSSSTWKVLTLTPSLCLLFSCWGLTSSGTLEETQSRDLGCGACRLGTAQP